MIEGNVTCRIMETSQSKVIVITGATYGLGNAMAREFLRLGHKVAGCGRTRAIAEKLTQEFNSIADRCDFAAVDVTQDCEVNEWAKQVLKKFGPPDFLINNAAIAGTHMNFWELPAEEFDRVVDVDIKGPANTTRHFVPHMISSGKGVVCNVTSWVGRNNLAKLTAAVTGKWGLEGFSRNLAKELPDPLVSFQLDPGVVLSPMNEKTMPPEELAKQVTAEEWASKVCPAVLAIDRSMNGELMETWKLGLKCALYVDENGKLKLDDRE